MKLKRALLLILLFVAGMVAGAFLAQACAGVYGLSWLAFSRGIGINPAAPLVLDLSVFQFSFGFYIDISIAQIVTVALAMVLYGGLARRIR